MKDYLLQGHVWKKCEHGIMWGKCELHLWSFVLHRVDDGRAEAEWKKQIIFHSNNKK